MTPARKETLRALVTFRGTSPYTYLVQRARDSHRRAMNYRLQNRMSLYDDYAAERRAYLFAARCIKLGAESVVAKMPGGAVPLPVRFKSTGGQS